MKCYTFVWPITGSCDVHVAAESEEEAVEKIISGRWADITDSDYQIDYVSDGYELIVVDDLDEEEQ